MVTTVYKATITLTREIDCGGCTAYTTKNIYEHPPVSNPRLSGTGRAVKQEGILMFVSVDGADYPNGDGEPFDNVVQDDKVRVQYRRRIEGQ